MKKRRTTKDKILETLKKEGQISIKDLAEHFSISEVAIRRHIHDLIRQNLVQEEEVKQEIGRPYYIYSLTGRGHQTFPNQYEQMPVELLKDVKELYGEKAVDELLRHRRKREEEEFLNQLQEENFDEKVTKLVELLRGKGYMIEYKQAENGDYEIFNYHCPIFNVSSKYNHVCNYEKKMYQNIFSDSIVTDLSCLSKGSQRCYWIITHPKNKLKHEA